MLFCMLEVVDGGYVYGTVWRVALFAGGVGADGADAMCAAMYAGGREGWALFARGDGGDAVYATLYAGGCGRCALFAGRCGG